MIVAGVWLVGAVVWLVRPPRHNGVAGLGRGLVGVVGSLGMGSLLGVVMGAALAIAPTWLVSRGLLRGLLAALLAGTLFLGEVVVLGVATDGGYGFMLLALLAAPIVAATAAAHSGDIAGRSHHHAWLWAPAPGRWRSKVRQTLR
jgi:hypothetical protein